MMDRRSTARCISAFFALLCVCNPLAEVAQGQANVNVAAQQGSPIEFHVATVQLPEKDLESTTQGWMTISSSMGTSTSSSNGAVVLASHKPKTFKTIAKASTKLTSNQIEALFDRYKSTLMKPQVISQGPTSAEFLFGQSREFTTSYGPTLDKDGNPTGEMEPKKTSIAEGLTLKLNGRLNGDANVLQLKIDHNVKYIKGIGSFSFETGNGPFIVQQPEVATSGTASTLNLNPTETLAVCGGPLTRTVTKSKPVPVIGKVPFLGKLFKNSSMTSENYYLMTFVRFEIGQ